MILVTGATGNVGTEVIKKLAEGRHPTRAFVRNHGAVEHYIQKSGIPHTFLRPNLFMQGLLNFRPTIASQGVFLAPVSHARISIVDVRDVGEVAAKILTVQRQEGKTLDLTGPEALTHAEMAEQLSQAMGKPIRHVEVSPEVMKETLVKSGFPAWQAEGVAEDYESHRKGETEQVSSAVRDITGYEATFFAQFALDYALRFAGKATGKTAAGKA